MLADELNAFYGKGAVVVLGIPRGGIVIASQISRLLKAQLDIVFLSAGADRAKRFRRVRPKVALGGKTVIVTDDGVATGSTMQAALLVVRQEKPKKLIAAFPVGAKEPIALLECSADEVIALRVPDFLDAIGQFYLNFEQVSDGEVLRILDESGRIAVPPQ